MRQNFCYPNVRMEQRKEVGENMVKKKYSYKFEEDGEVLTVSLVGEIDHHSAVAIRGEIDNKIKELNPDTTVIDLEQINFMDSSGLGLIMGRYALMQRIGGTLVLKNPNKKILQIFDMAGLGRIVKIEEKRGNK